MKMPRNLIACAALLCLAACGDSEKSKTGDDDVIDAAADVGSDAPKGDTSLEDTGPGDVGAKDVVEDGAQPVDVPKPGDTGTQDTADTSVEEVTVPDVTPQDVGSDDTAPEDVALEDITPEELPPVDAGPGDPCEPNPCQNGGTCQADADGISSCKCVDGFSGELCETEDPPPGMAGETCADAIMIDPLALPYEDISSSEGYENDYHACAALGVDDAPDIAYSFTPQTSGVYQISMPGYEDGQGPSIVSVVTDCASLLPGGDDECVFGHDFYGLFGEPVPVSMEAGVTYFIVVDSYSSFESGNYILALSDVCPTQCDGQSCGQDNGCGGTCGCGVGEICVEQVCQDGGEPDPAKLCTDTGGEWLPETCGDWLCGEPPMCEAIIPGCNCGLQGNFDPQQGCVKDPDCGGEPGQGTLLINEIDYDQPGIDADEFIELYNPGPGDVDGNGLYIVLLNGSNGKAYDMVSLAGLLIPAGGYALALGPDFESPLPLAIPSVAFKENIQNGADAVAVVKGDPNLDDPAPVLWDALAYEGVFVPEAGVLYWMGEGAHLDGEQGPNSLGRCPNGSDTNDNAADFKAAPPSPGSANICVVIP